MFELDVMKGVGLKWCVFEMMEWRGNVMKGVLEVYFFKG